MKPVIARVPGDVVAVFARPGERVPRGQVLLEVNVFGMREKVAAPVAGSVALVWVQRGMKLK